MEALIQKLLIFYMLIFLSCTSSINSQLTNLNNDKKKNKIIRFDIFKDQVFLKSWEKKTVEAVEASILLKQFNDNPNYLYLWIEPFDPENKDLPITNNRKPLIQYFGESKYNMQLEKLIVIELILALDVTTIRDIVIGISTNDSIAFLFDNHSNNVIKEKKLNHLTFEDILDKFNYKNCNSEDVMIVSSITSADMKIKFIANLCEEDYLLAKKILE